MTGRGAAAARASDRGEFGQNANKVIRGPDGSAVAVRLADGEVLTRAELLAPRGRWTPKTRLMLVLAAEAGLIGAAEVHAAHRIGAEEWAEWVRRRGASARAARAERLQNPTPSMRERDPPDWICARSAASRARSAEAARRRWRRERGEAACAARTRIGAA